jgi:hypothetical protein
MPISETQLETWSYQGSITQSSATYNAIKNALEEAHTPYSSKDYSVFLQGSYGNDTNIYAESDVDIVISLTDCWQSDLEALPQNDQELYANAFDDATYTLFDFKRDVLNVLRETYGNDVRVGAKAIEISALGNRRKADVIVSMQFRRYYMFKTEYAQAYHEGICFYNAMGGRIANYPKHHSANLTLKHKNTNGWWKPTVRILKNLREKLVSDGRLRAGVAPSYYIEGLLYNVPDEKFASSFQDCFVNALNWIQNEADWSKLVCANGQYYLLWENSPTSWSTANCELFLSAAIELWNEW